MKLRRMRDLARDLGIPRETFQKWLEKDPSLGVYRTGGRGGGSWWIKLDKLAGKQGIATLQDAYMLGTGQWVKAVAFATASGISRKTIANWCRYRPGFAKRIGRVYYIDLNEFGATEQQALELRRKLGLGNPSQTPPEEE